MIAEHGCREFGQLFNYEGLSLQAAHINLFFFHSQVLESFLNPFFYVFICIKLRIFPVRPYYCLSIVHLGCNTIGLE